MPITNQQVTFPGNLKDPHVHEIEFLDSAYLVLNAQPLRLTVQYTLCNIPYNKTRLFLPPMTRATHHFSFSLRPCSCIPTGCDRMGIGLEGPDWFRGGVVHHLSIGCSLQCLGMHGSLVAHPPLKDCLNTQMNLTSTTESHARLFLR